ncbi:MAG TPA: SPFH domain-containing protein [Candidatus Saccharibacteria bacterium]|nr:SPFH domain-containing protein [Candidatus Saccharibacteria bacterium]
MNIRIATAAVAGLAVLLSGCSSYETESDQVAVAVDGNALTPANRTILGCYGESEGGWDGPGDSHYYYPAGQRTYKFAGADEDEAKALGADGPAIKVVKDNITLMLSGTVTFSLNTDCDVLKKFHQQIGVKKWGEKKKAAWISDGGDESYYGWDAMLDVYIEQPLQRAATDALLAEQKTYLDLYNGSGRAEFEQAIQADLPGSVESLAGGNYFVNFKVQIQKPSIPTGVAEALTAKEIAKAQNEAQKLANETVQTELESIRALVEVLGQQGYIDYQRNKLSAQQLELLKQAIESGKVTILPVPTGSNVTIPTTK